MQALQNPAPATTIVPATTTQTTAQQSVAVPLGLSLTASAPTSSLVPQNAIIPGAQAPAVSATTTASNAALIKSLYAEVQTLEAQIAALESAPSTSSAVTSSTFTRNLRLNDQGPDVLALQQFLNTHGYPVAATGPGSRGEETTFFGPATYRALASYQAANDLPATGYFGPMTRALMSAPAASASASSAATTGATTSSSTPNSASSGSSSAATSPVAVVTSPGYGGGGGAPATPAAPTCSISAAPASIAIGSSTALTWTSSNASSASLNQGIGSVSPAGTQSASPITTTTYTLSVTGSGGSGTCSTTVTATDTQAPTQATNLSAVAASLSELDLSWTASTDNVGVAGYKIFRDGTQVATDTSGTTYADTGLTASSTHTYYVKAYDAAGNVASASNVATSTTGVWADGFAGAPAGTPQLPNLFQGYATRPPWRIPGVDYYVGVPSGTSLSDWESIPTSCNGGTVTISTTTQSVIFNRCASPTVNAVDFSLHGGAVLVFQACTGTITVTNSKFSIGNGTIPSAYTVAIIYVDNETTVNFDLERNTILGGYPPNPANSTVYGAAAVRFLGGGTFTEHYNYITDSSGNATDVGYGPGGSANMTVDARWNAFVTNGLNINGQHSNVFVSNFSTTAPGPIGASWTMDFNLGYQPGGQTDTGSDAWQLEGANDDSDSLHAAELAYNALLVTYSGSTWGGSSVIHGNRDSSSPAATGNSSVHDNYLDPNSEYFTSGSQCGFYPGVWAGWTLSNNIDMVDDSPCTTAP